MNRYGSTLAALTELEYDINKTRKVEKQNENIVELKANNTYSCIYKYIEACCGLTAGFWVFMGGVITSNK